VRNFPEQFAEVRDYIERKVQMLLLLQI